jgi:hypothetical protein
MLRRRCRRRPWFSLVIFLLSFIFSSSISLCFYDWPSASLCQILLRPTNSPSPTHPQTQSLANWSLLSTLKATLVDQFALYRELCPNSDWARPVTRTCRNFTGASETALSTLSAFHLFQSSFIPEIFADPPALLAQAGTEVGYVADYVIAPLVGAFLVSGLPKYLNLAARVGNGILSLHSNSLFAPFIAVGDGQFGAREVFLDLISSVYPVLAALAVHTNDKKFIAPILTFLSVMNESITKTQIPNRYLLKTPAKGMPSAVLDVPWSVYTGIARVRKILPKLKTEGFLQLVPAFMSESNPLKFTFVRDLNEIFMYSVQPCSAGAYLPTNHPMFPLLLKKCSNFVKRNPLPSRLNGASEFGTFDLETGSRLRGSCSSSFGGLERYRRRGQ